MKPRDVTPYIPLLLPLIDKILALIERALGAGVTPTEPESVALQNALQKELAEAKARRERIEARLVRDGGSAKNDLDDLARRLAEVAEKLEKGA